MTLTVTAPTEPGPVPEHRPALTELSPAISQQVFRSCLDVLARPGLVRRLPGDAVPARVPAAVAPLLALTDLMVGLAGIGPAAGTVVRQIARTTGAAVTDPGSCRFALALHQSTTIADLSAGSAWSPELGALLCQRVSGFGVDADLGLVLQGPGVDGCAELAVAGLSASFFEQRQRLVAQPPAGIDVLLITDDGLIAGLPRTTMISTTEVGGC